MTPVLLVVPCMAAGAEIEVKSNHPQACQKQHQRFCINLSKKNFLMVLKIKFLVLMTTKVKTTGIGLGMLDLSNGEILEPEHLG
jgi:hypothetical protein